MAFGVAGHGVNGIIYVSGAELVGANAWSISISTNSAEYVKFGDTWLSRVVGPNDWAGTIGAVHDQDGQQLQDAACAGAAVALLIYPARTDLTAYYSGDAIFEFGSDANSTSAVAHTASFVGHSTMSYAFA